jgi:putative transposase
LGYTLSEAQIIERWRHRFDTVRPHSSLGYRPPAPETKALTLPEEAGGIEEIPKAA